MQIGVENRDGQTMVENILLDAVHDILEGDELDTLLDRCEKKPTGLFSVNVTEDEPPSCQVL